MRNILWVMIIFVAGAAFFPGRARAQILIDDFEDVGDWSGLVRDDTVAMEGGSSGRWSNTTETTAIRKEFLPPLDFSPYAIFSVWVYSRAANGARLQLVFDSDNDADPEGWDYYSRELTIDWEGWRYVRIPLEDIGAARHPIGWNVINSVSLSASGWSHEPLPDTDLSLDAMTVSNGVARIDGDRYFWDGGDFVYEYDITVENGAGASRTYALSFFTDAGLQFSYAVEPSTLAVPAGSSGSAAASIRIPAAFITESNFLYNEFNMLVVSEGGAPADALMLRGTVPLPRRDHPALLLDSDDVARIQDWAGRLSWAAGHVDRIVGEADGWPADFEADYSLGGWTLPPEGGQWSLWYVCPVHNVYLRYEGPGRNVCPVGGENYTGWPYDQVIYGRMHGDLAGYALRLGQAYVLTGEAAYAADAREILTAYADRYMSYPIHDVNGGSSTSGARVLAQTLDESGWLIDVAWAYDLVAGSGVLSDGEKAHVEKDLLRASASTIARNDAGESNWQSWHNAAVSAVGFTLDDPRLISGAWNTGSGFLFQMGRSVSSDGFWYEGSWGYHFYALSALTATTEMAMRGGLDPLAGGTLLSMFTAPVYFAEPDGSLPPFNDSGRSSLGSSRSLYESAYRWSADPVLASVPDPSSRPLEALFWGAEEIAAPASSAALQSMIFEGSGFAVLRAGMGGADPLYLALDYGPHGGWHGHYDKLGFVFYALGAEAAVDPGTHSYALDIHEGYDKTTAAHNTVVVDMRNQPEATGSLTGSALLPDVSLVKAEGGEACAEAGLAREMLVTDAYVIDRFEAASRDGGSHRYDWILHARGRMQDPGVPSSAYAFAGGDGYGYFENVERIDAAPPLRLSWDYSEDAGTEAGTWWGSDPGIAASFVVSDEQAAGGDYSGKMHYDFSAADGYVIFSLDAPEGVPPDAAPEALALDLRGDGSGNAVAFRLYDSTDERFVYDAGNLDFGGWRHFDAADLPAWSHYLGNDDGVFDPPVKTISVEVSREAGGSAVSDLYVDNVELVFGGVPVQVADFEVKKRYLGMLVPAEGGGEGLEVVTGQGPSSWSEVIPFAMMRKEGTAAAFIALIQPSSADGQWADLAPLGASSCPASGCRGYVVKDPRFTDAALWDPAFGPGGQVLEMTGEGGDYSTDGLLGYGRREAAGGTWIRMDLAGGTSLTAQSMLLFQSSRTVGRVQVDLAQEGRRADLTVELAEEAELRILAPLAQQAFVNGEETAFTRDGDYIIINAQPTVAEDSVDGEGAEPSENPDGAADGGEGEEGEGSQNGCGCSLAR